MMGIIIREAIDADKPAVAAVMSAATAQLRRVYRPTGSAIARAKAMNVRWLVAELDGQAVGALRYWREEDRLHLGLGVLPTMHRRGIGRRLIEALADKARRQGLSKLALYTVRQTGNVPIFQRLGFATIREEPAADLESASGGPLMDVYMERAIGPTLVAESQPA
jgi:GNAT superfamily N-acetyltransferase